VKELIPQFYSGNGEFLRNSNDLELGETQDGKRVCVCVCVHVCMCVCMYVCVCMGVCMYVLTITHMMYDV